MKRGLKLYVWQNVLRDYTYGIMFALASSADEARELILKDSRGLSSVARDLKHEPEEYDDKVSFFLHGGG